MAATHDQSCSALSLPWQWILEHIIDLKDVGTPILKEITTYIPDVKKCSGLQKRVALRYLEEVIASGKIDARAIPLVKALIEDYHKRKAQGKAAVSNSSLDSELLLRVQTEAVLTHLRGRKDGSRNWQRFTQALDHIFQKEEMGTRLAERRKELLMLLRTQDQERTCSEMLKRHSIDTLRHDLFTFLTLEKSHLGQTFLNQLLHDAFVGRYPLQDDLVGKGFRDKEGSKANDTSGKAQRKSVGSDEETIFCVRDSDDDSEVGTGRREYLEGDKKLDEPLRDHLASTKLSVGHHEAVETKREPPLPRIHAKGDAGGIVHKTRKRSSSVEEIKEIRQANHGVEKNNTRKRSSSVEEIKEISEANRAVEKNKTRKRSSSVEEIKEISQANHAVEKSCQPDLVDVGTSERRKSQRVSHRIEHGPAARLRLRDQDGKAVTSNSPLKRVEEGCNLRRALPEDESERVDVTVVQDDKENSLGVDFNELEFFDIGDDGHEELCHKCKHPGTLLCCEGCPIAVHERCLGPNTSKGVAEKEWYCPVCIQKRAVEAVARAKQEAREARQRLADFMMGAGVKQAHHRLNGDSSKPLSGRPETEFRERSQAVASDEKVVRRGSEKSSSSKIHLAEKSKPPELTSSKPEEGYGGESGHHSDSRENDNKPLAGPSDTGIEPTSKKRSSATHYNVNDPCDTNEDHPQGEDGDGHDGDLEEDSEGSKIEDELQSGRKQLRRNRDSSEDSHMRARRGHIVRGNRIIPGVRRQRLPWSKLEENTLKDGVRKFSHDDGAWGFQWRRILEFGQGKFHASRTCVDLKDKWRNLAKAYEYDL